MSKHNEKKQEDTRPAEGVALNLNPADHRHPEVKSPGTSIEDLVGQAAVPLNPQAEIEELRAENARLRAHRDEPRTKSADAEGSDVQDEERVSALAKEVPAGYFRNRRGAVVSNEFRGERLYKAELDLFVDGKLVKAGDLFKAVDEAPGSAWVPLREEQVTQMVASKPLVPAPNLRDL